MFDTRTRLFFAWLKDAAGAALTNAAPAPGSNLQKNRLRLRSRPKSGGSRRLRNTGTMYSIQQDVEIRSRPQQRPHLERQQIQLHYPSSKKLLIDLLLYLTDFSCFGLDMTGGAQYSF